LTAKKVNISGKPEREEIFDYPIEALREALINAVVHRDYDDFGTEIVIKIFNNHIWFYNPGGLYGGITLEQIIKSHTSKTRNPQLMKTLFLVKAVEQFGSGIQRMYELCQKEILPPPEIKEENGGFSVRLYKEYKNLNVRQRKALEYLRDGNKFITNQIYKQINNMIDNETIRKQVQRELDKLIEQGILQLEGTKKAAKYSLRQD
jgi:ATP-dependent DNA helicase RecG